MAFCMHRSFQSATLTRARVLNIVNGSQRAFSSTPSFFRGALPEFLPASSPELTELLSTLNRLILFPHHFTKQQAQLAFRKENAARLESEPVEITLGNVTLPLVHINRFNDVPTRKTHISRILKSSKTPADWENVVRMLEGLADAKIPLRKGMMSATLRAIADAGMPNLILKAVQRGTDTGLLLKDEDMAVRVLRLFTVHAARNNWDAAETEKILGMMEQVIEVMDEPAHLGNKPLSPGDPRTSPLLIGLVANMAAIHAKNAGEGDTDGKVEKYTKRLVSALREDIQSLEVHINSLERFTTPADATNSSKLELHAVMAAMAIVKRLTPIQVALRDSRELLGDKMPEQEFAKRWEDKLGSAVEAARTAINVSKEIIQKEKELKANASLIEASQTEELKTETLKTEELKA